MEYITLGKSDLRISRICMGCMGFGIAAAGMHSWTIDEKSSAEIIRHGFDLGINFFDTAIAYQGGTSEQFTGRALRNYVGREEYVIATKFLPRTQEEIDRRVTGQQHVKNNIEQSLRNLGLDYIDLYICHMWDYHTSMEEIMEGLHSVVKEGKARYIGMANCFAWQLAKANFYARENGLTEFISMQGHYNLLAREEEREMIPFCHDQQIGLTPYSALAAGRLSKRPGETSKRLQEDAYSKFKYDSTAEEDGKIVARVNELADRHRVSMTEVALSWLLTKVDSPIVGATKVSHVDGAVKALELKLSEEEVFYLEELYVPHALAGVMAQNGKQRAGNVI